MKAIAMTWYEVSIRFEKIADNGNLKITNETHVLRSISFTDAEKDANQLGTMLTESDFEVKNITPRDYVVLYMEDKFEAEQTWFKARIRFLNEDEKGKIVKTTQTWLIKEEKLAEAVRLVNRHFADKPMVNWELVSVAETKINSVETF